MIFSCISLDIEYYGGARIKTHIVELLLDDVVLFASSAPFVAFAFDGVLRNKVLADFGPDRVRLGLGRCVRLVGFMTFVRFVCLVRLVRLVRAGWTRLTIGDVRVDNGLGLRCWLWRSRRRVALNVNVFVDVLAAVTNAALSEMPIGLLVETYCL